MTDPQALETMIATAVERFYRLAEHDPVIGPVFAAAIADWPGHLQVVRDFWSKILLGTERYQGNPFQAHAGMTLAPALFDRWLELFAAVAAATLPPAEAAKALAQARHMRACLQGGTCDHRPRRIVPQRAATRA
ncbi:MAG: group III truncated hemoglobin [Magnetospirillum sp.]|nr:group III truncated hemoglobin [Magnetospirillum sp.]